MIHFRPLLKTTTIELKYRKKKKIEMNNSGKARNYNLRITMRENDLQVSSADQCKQLSQYQISKAVYNVALALLV